MMKTNHGSRGFTLIELLVVISIILILATLGLTKLVGARRDAEMLQTKDNLSQIFSHLQRYETKSKGRRLPSKSGSEFVLSIWGGRILEKTPNNAKIFFCGSLGVPELTEDSLEEWITPENIHFAGRNQEDKAYRVLKLSVKNASKTILVCNKPVAEGEAPHQGEALAVLYASGDVGEITREDFGEDWDDYLIIGPDSPVEALHGLMGAPGDENY